MIRWAVLSSGSCGNSYVFYDGKDSVLIDMGLSFSALSKRLELYDIPKESIRACFLTHMHPDHSKGLGVLSRKLNVPIYMSNMTINGEKRWLDKLNISKELLFGFDFPSAITLSSFLIFPFRTSHDSIGSCGFRIRHPEKSFFLLTDSGLWNEEMVSCLKESDVCFVESNYDPEMLANGPYPLDLKNRIMGKFGHLSNIDAMDLIKTANIHYKMVYFIHLSDENNSVKSVERVTSLLAADNKYIICERGQSYGDMEFYE